MARKAEGPVHGGDHGKQGIALSGGGHQVRCGLLGGQKGFLGGGLGANDQAGGPVEAIRGGCCIGGNQSAGGLSLFEFDDQGSGQGAGVVQHGNPPLRGHLEWAARSFRARHDIDNLAQDGLARLAGQRV